VRSAGLRTFALLRLLTADPATCKSRLTMSSYQTRLIAKTLLTVELDPSLKKRCAQIAAQHDETLSQVVRRALRQYAEANAQMELPRAAGKKKRLGGVD
jgi:hypothetical protein